MAGQLEKRSRAGRRLSIVVPMHNEEPGVDLFFERVFEVARPWGVEIEVICVDDGSGDGTLNKLLAWRERDPRVKVIALARNFGKESALTAGLEAARGDMVVPIDADLQDPPELIGVFIERWEEGYDVVYGERRSRRMDTAAKRFTASLFYRLFNAVSQVPIPANTGDFRLMDRVAVEALRALPERNRFMKGLFSWIGFSQVGVPYDRPERAAGQTSFRYWRLWNFALDGITSFSSAPLRIWSYFGVGVAAVALCWAAYLVYVTLVHGRSVPGYASLMVVALVGLSIQLIALGIIGEYLGRIYQETKQRPLYLVRARYGVTGREDAS